LLDRKFNEDSKNVFKTVIFSLLILKYNAFIVKHPVCVTVIFKKEVNYGQLLYRMVYKSGKIIKTFLVSNFP